MLKLRDSVPWYHLLALIKDKATLRLSICTECKQGRATFRHIALVHENARNVILEGSINLANASGAK